MDMATRWFFIILAFPFLASVTPSKIIFFSGNLSSAKTKAANEGKLYFAEFSASWCAPCRLLEETTFSDPTVIDYISKNYIPVKIDIDDFDGIAMKQVYNVKSIPTIIVFNSKGQLLEKYDQALPTSKMLALLKKHNIPANRVKAVSAVKPKPTISNSTTTALAKESHSPMKPSSTPSRPDKT
ncbi:MAG: thioredoxin 1, partial [Saprospiraceae bacterium]